MIKLHDNILKVNEINELKQINGMNKTSALRKKCLDMENGFAEIDKRITDKRIMYIKLSKDKLADKLNELVKLTDKLNTGYFAQDIKIIKNLLNY